ncbi:unnamed protein product [Rhizoctonia solani]|uniref:PNPLA domain-containing protein n=1 Tax=Rhizoctonia solani TaxID=456999 RepID=A0A8H3A9R0_9AGAM|nr:unnamed protein product [Rhizoctonia solani]
MSISSNGTWIYVADRGQQQEPKSDIGATATRRPMGIPISPKELDRQQEILDYYNNRKKLEAQSSSGQTSGVTQSRLLRHLRSMPSFPKHGGHHRDLTVSSTGATVGPCYPETQVQTPTPPPVTSRRRKNTSIPPPVPNPLWVPFRSVTEPPPPPLPSHPSRGLLNVNTIVDSSPSMLTPSASPYSAPISSSPPVLPLLSLPPGYDFALARFRPEANKLRPLRLLSLDGGGVRGISSLKILKDIMDRIKPGARPCEYFDLIAGTSTGGSLIAIMLGRLRMSVDECILNYHRLAKQIFKRNPAAQAGSLAFVEHRFSPDNLEEAIRQVVAKLSPSNTKMADHHQHCARTFVVAVRKHNVNNHAARRIRTYATQHQPADTCEIWEAGRATSAAPSYFPPIKLKDEYGQLRSYIDGGLGYNNPSKELLNEARDVFGPEHTIGCFLSIGTGVDRNTGFQDVRRLNSAYDAFKAIALNSEQAHRELNEYFSRTPGVYFRFNAGARLVGPNGDEDFAKQVALEDWHKMDQIENLTSQYLREEGSIRSVKSVHQANLATFRSFRKTIEELTLKPRTVLGDHASLVKRIQEWRKTVSALTVWVTDDRAYYQQARPEIVSMLEAVFDSVRAVDTVRSQIAGPDWVKASEKEFEYLLQDYIKLIEIAFPPHRQGRYNTPADQDPLNRGKILYNGLYSFRRRLAEVRGVPIEQRRTSVPQMMQDSTLPQQQPTPSMPSNFQSISVPLRTVSQGHVEQAAFNNGVKASHMQPYTQPANIVRTHSLPTGSMVPIRPAITSNHTTPQVADGMQQLPQLPHLLTPSQGKPQVVTQGTLVKRSPTPPAAQPTAGSVPSFESDVITDAVPAEEQDWDLNLNWDELEALDRSEWQDEGSMQIQGDAHLGPAPNIAESAMGALPESGSLSGPQAKLASANEQDTPTEPNLGELSRGAPLAQPKEFVPDVLGSEVEDSSTRIPPAGHEHILEHPESSAEDVIDIDELPGDEATTGPDLQVQKQPPTKPASQNLDEDVINIQYSDDEMEVDELDPSEPTGSIRQSEQPDDKPTGAFGQTTLSKSQTPQPLAAPRPAPIPNQQLVTNSNALPPHVRAEIRQKAKEPLIAHYLSIQPSESREAAEKRFEQMSDQEVLDIYDKMGHARRMVDHYKNRLVQSSHKIHLPHIDVREPPKEPPTLLCSVAGAMRLSSETVEFSIPPAVIASLERWRARFVTPAGSHGDLITVELACYSKDAFHPPEGKGRRELTPNAQTRTWPDGGILWAFVNTEDEAKDRNVRLFLSPPPFVSLMPHIDSSNH